MGGPTMADSESNPGNQKVPTHMRTPNFTPEGALGTATRAPSPCPPVSVPRNRLRQCPPSTPGNPVPQHHLLGQPFEHRLLRFRFRFTWGDLQPDCSADRPVTDPRQST
eukprot:1158653-Pelagomonas_calceolata.AAC.8